MQASTVLIVEDDVLVALILEEILTEAGFRTVGVYRSGAAALEHVKREPPDVLMLDIVLQGQLSGIEVARVVRRFWAGPIMFHTSASDSHQREQMASVPNSTVVLKPAAKAALIRALRSVLPG